MKKVIQRIFHFLIVILIIFIGTITEQQKTEMQDVSLYTTEVEEVKQAQPVIHEIQEEPITESSQPAEDAIALESSSPIQIEAKTEMVMDEVEEEEEGIKIVMISVYEPETDVIPLPTTKSSFNLSEIKGFHILGNRNEKPLNLIVSSNYIDGSEKIHYLDWDAKHPNEFKLYNPLGYEAFVRVYDNAVQVAQFAVDSFSDDEYIALDLDLDITTEFACIQ